MLQARFLFFALFLVIPDIGRVGHRPDFTLGEYRVQDQFIALPASMLRDEELSQFFQSWTRYPEDMELRVVVSSDREFIKRLDDPVPEIRNLEYPVSRPLTTEQPLAVFWKIGRNAFFELRDSSGRTAWKTLSGINLFSTSVKGLRIILVGDRYTRSQADGTSAFAHSLTSGAPNLEMSNIEKIGEICRFYDRQIAQPRDLIVHIYRSVEDVRESFPLPTMEALAIGYKGGGQQVPTDARATYWRAGQQVRIWEARNASFRDIRLESE